MIAVTIKHEYSLDFGSPLQLSYAFLLMRSTRYTLPHFEVVRAKMILMAADGESNDQIAARLDTRREVVSLWRKRFHQQRLRGLEELPRSARPQGFPQIWGSCTASASVTGCRPCGTCRGISIAA